MLKSHYLNKIEPVLFGLVLLIHLIPIFTCSPFITLDGPAHLYNASIISSLLKADVPALNHLFEFNTFPEPNWTGHAILVLLLQIFPALIAEQILLILILVITSISFRKLLITIDKSNNFYSWIIFPFLYNIVFCYGFYNYCIGLSILPFILTWWINNKSKPNNFRKITIGLISLMLLYFSHLVIFLIGGLFMLVITIFDYSKWKLKEFINQVLYLALIALPGVILTCYYLIVFGTNGFHGEIVYIKYQKLIEDIIHGSSFIIYNFDSELIITRWMPVILVISTIIGVIQRKKNQYFSIFLSLLIISFLLIFLIPDSMASGGFLSIRTIALFFLMWSIWLGTLSLKLIPKILLISSFLFISFFQLHSHQETRKELSVQTTQLKEITSILKDNTTLLPLNYNHHWMLLNISTYIGSYKRIAVLDNYEANFNRFPIHWKNGMRPDLTIGNFTTSDLACVNLKKFETATGVKVNYITRFDAPAHPTDSCTLDVIKQLNEEYQLIYKQDLFEVYERK